MMDAQPEFPGSSEAGFPKNLIEPGDLRSILSNLSQEFSRQLLSLRAGFDILLSDSSTAISADQRQHVHVMVNLCDDLLRLTRSYVEYAGLVQGGAPLCLGRFSIGGFVKEIDRVHGRLAAEHGRGWNCRLDGDDTKVTTDAGRCQRIFEILVANAVRYTPEGAEVRVAARSDGTHWVVSVSDDGPGIPKEDLERVFEPFYKLPRDERAKMSGDGLGLAICREMVEQLGGEIALNSAFGKGTQVKVRFPVVASEKDMSNPYRRFRPATQSL